MIHFSDINFVFPKTIPDLNNQAYLESLKNISHAPLIGAWDIIIVLLVFTLLSIYGLLYFYPLSFIHPPRSALAFPLFLIPVILIVGTYYVHSNISARNSLQPYSVISLNPQRFTVKEGVLVKVGWVIANNYAQSFRYPQRRVFFKAGSANENEVFTSPYMPRSLLFDVKAGDKVYVAIDSQNEFSPTFLGISKSDHK